MVLIIFYFEILKEGIKNKEELDDLEIEYIKQYHSLCEENGYNVENGGNSVGKHSEETKRKISEAQIGEKNHMYGKVGKLNATSKKVIELTTGIIYESAMQASKILNINFSHICATARGARGSTGGFVFRYLDENNNIIQNDNFAKIKSFKTRESILPEFLYLFDYFN